MLPQHSARRTSPKTERCSASRENVRKNRCLRTMLQVERGLEHGLPAASSVIDRTIPTFSRGELPHFAGINTFMKVQRSNNTCKEVQGMEYNAGGTGHRDLGASVRRSGKSAPVVNEMSAITAIDW